MKLCVNKPLIEVLQDCLFEAKRQKQAWAQIDLVKSDSILNDTIVVIRDSSTQEEAVQALDKMFGPGCGYVLLDTPVHEISKRMNDTSATLAFYTEAEESLTSLISKYI